ncbi:ROK family transcriptional regulator [Rathayibacter sp. CAU 1779]
MTQPKPDLGGMTSRSVVLDLIRSRGPISRVQLALVSGYTQATISNLVRQLSDEGLVIESGERQYTGGKPRVMLTINPRARFAIGIQLGQDATTYVVIDMMGAVIGRVRAPGVRGSSPDDVVPLVVSRTLGLLDTLNIERSRVVGIGLAAPGPLDLTHGSIESDAFTAWHGFAVRAAVQEATGLPTVLDNDATSAGVGEFWGRRKTESVAHCTVYMGAGIGAGIIVGGSVYRGTSSNTGEIGRMRASAVQDGLPRRTLEDMAAPHAVAAAARAALAKHERTGVTLTVDDSDWFEDFTRVAAAAAHGDELAIRLIEASADLLAEAVLTLAEILDLDSIALAGPAFAVAGPIYLRAVRNRIASDFSSAKLHPLDVTLSHHVVDAAAVGVATVVLQQELAPRSIGAPAFGEVDSGA